MNFPIRKISATTPDKVNGKFVKFRKGDCLGIKINDRYLAALITEKFNKYYDLTLIQYYNETSPTLTDFLEGKFFGTRFGSWEELAYASDRRMIECKLIDNSLAIELVGRLDLVENIIKASYGYEKTIEDLYQFYEYELPIRIEKTNNAEKFPDLAFVSNHLVEVKNILTS